MTAWGVMSIKVALCGPIAQRYPSGGSVLCTETWLSGSRFFSSSTLSGPIAQRYPSGGSVLCTETWLSGSRFFSSSTLSGPIAKW